MLIFGLAATGALTGIFGALAGIGGGVLLVPLLTGLFDLPIHIAIGASLMSVLATSSVAAAAYLRQGIVHLRLALILQTTTVVGAIIGSLTASRLEERVLAGLFALLMAGLVFNFLRREKPAPADAATHTRGRIRLSGSFIDPRLRKPISYRVRNAEIGLVTSAAAGTLSGMLGIGGGVIQVPLMVSVMGVPIRAAAATSSYMIGLTAVASLSVYLAAGFFDPKVAVSVMSGTMAGAYIGSRLQGRVDSSILRWLFILIMCVLGIQMGLRAGGWSI